MSAIDFFKNKSLSVDEIRDVASYSVKLYHDGLKKEFSEIVDKLKTIRDKSHLFSEDESVSKKLAEDAADILVTISFLRKKALGKPMTREKSLEKANEKRLNPRPGTVPGRERERDHESEDLRRDFKGIEKIEDFEKKKEEIKKQKIKEGKEPIVFKHDFKKINEPLKSHRSEATGNDEWYTPVDIIEKARYVMGSIELDPASNKTAQENVQADIFYTKQDDGLKKEWKAKTFWMNPPYSRALINQFIDKFLYHYTNNDIEKAIILVHNNTETKWGQSLLKASDIIFFPSKRVRFLNWENKEKKETGSLQGQMLLGFNVDTEKFVDELKEGLHAQCI